MDALDPAARSLLAEGRQLHVGVLTTKGPHVTPELYTADERHVWFLTAADTLKTRVVRRDPRVAALVRVGSRTAILAGEVADYDVGDPMRLLTQAREALGALAAITSFTVRNAVDLAAFARDLATGRLPSRLPPRRVLLRLTPDRSMLLDGTALVATGGSWSGLVTVPDEAPPMVGDLDCVIGAETDDGLVVLPGRCDDALATASVPAVAAQLGEVPTDRDVRGCLVVDDYNAPGPAAKRGALMRGTLRVHVEGPLARIDVDAERQTTWDGAATHTSPAG